MKKWILIGLGAIVAIVAVSLWVGLSNLGALIQGAVNTYGPKMTGTAVSLGEVKVSLLSGKAELRDFTLGNPKGFQAPHALVVKSVAVDLDEKSLAGETIVIDRIELVGPEITYEKGSGTDNFRAILDHLNRSVGANDPAKGDAGKEGKKLLIRNFIVRDGKVNLALTMLGGRGISASLPDIHLRDVGRKDGGASASETFKEIFAELNAKVTSSSVTDSFNQGLKKLGTSLDEATGAARKRVEGAAQEVRGKAEEVRGKAEEIKGKAEALADQMKGLFK